MRCDRASAGGARFRARVVIATTRHATRRVAELGIDDREPTVMARDSIDTAVPMSVGKSDRTACRDLVGRGGWLTRESLRTFHPDTLPAPPRWTDWYEV